MAIILRPVKPLRALISIRTVGVGIVLAATVIGCGSPGATASVANAESSPLCTHLAHLHTARTDFLAALAAGRAGAFNEAMTLAKQARDEVTTVNEALAASADSRSEVDQSLATALVSVVLLIDQGALAIDGELGGTPSASDVEMVISTDLPVLDDQLLAADRLATTTEGSAQVRCPGSSFSFEPWQAVLGGAGFSPDVPALHLPASIDGVPLNVSTAAVSPDSPLARGIASVGGSLTTAYVADIESGDVLFSVVRVPGIDATALASNVGDSLWPEASRRTEVAIAGRPAFRFDTPDNPDVSPATNFAVPRGDTLFLFEDTDEQSVSAVMALIP